MFHNYSLPIGFVTSPRISDFYLYNLDEEMSNINGITYTRYADDILISSNQKELLKEAANKLKMALEKHGLEINNNKTVYKELIHDNDSIRFLGINLVKRNNDTYSFSISKRYLIETCKMITLHLLHAHNSDLSTKIVGRINYIKFVSKQSYEKLKKIIKIKIGYIPDIIYQCD